MEEKLTKSDVCQWKKGFDAMSRSMKKCNNCRYGSKERYEGSNCCHYTKDCFSLITTVTGKKFACGGYADMSFVYHYKTFIRKMRYKFKDKRILSVLLKKF